MKFQVILHEGVFDESLHASLTQELCHIYAKIFAVAEDQLSADITVIPKGRFFTAAKPSRTSLVGIGVPAGTSNTDRTRLMSEITSMWCRVTGCTANEVVISASDLPA